MITYSSHKLLNCWDFRIPEATSNGEGSHLGNSKNNMVHFLK